MAETGRDSAGRPCKLTEEHIQRVVHALLAGNYLETAAAFAGLHPKTLRSWMIAGAQKNARPLLRDLARRVRDAQAVAEVNAVAEIRAVGLGLALPAPPPVPGQPPPPTMYRRRDWRALAWWLRHAHPDRWESKAKDAADDVMNSPQWAEIQERILRCLADVPGAHEALAREFGGPAAGREEQRVIEAKVTSTVQ